ncbi:hypothetical protein ACQEVF_57970 [Nonomuraea polychroma]|uniref:hypothetical protein n=1 Tax=Nonomuraea polychroma TaxID=46176 RepID=UPI003D8B1AFE
MSNGGALHLCLGRRIFAAIIGTGSLAGVYAEVTYSTGLPTVGTLFALAGIALFAASFGCAIGLWRCNVDRLAFTVCCYWVTTAVVNLLGDRLGVGLVLLSYALLVGYLRTTYELAGSR